MCANPRPNGEKPGRTRRSSRPRTTIRARNIMCSRCSPIRRGASIWAMCATTPWAMWWRAIGARAGSTFSTRWAGTRSGCRPRTPPCRTTPVLRNGPTPISPPCGRNCSRWAFRSTGRARSRPAIRAYYKHQQKLFLDFLEADLVARKKSKVNWDPVDQTVLANEQVIDGRGWRSGAPVESRELTQWFLKITDYSDDLLASLDHLERWPEKVRLMQKNWIGRSEGLSVRFVIDPATLGALKGEPQTSELDIYTTRPDTLFGAKFMAIAPDHPLAAAAASMTRRCMRSSRRRASSARRSPRSRRQRRRATTRASKSCTRSIPIGACPSMSPISF